MSRYQLQLWTVNVLTLQRCNSIHSFGCLLDSLPSSFSYSWGSLELMKFILKILQDCIKVLQKQFPESKRVGELNNLSPYI